MDFLSLDDIQKSFGAAAVMRGATLGVREGEFMAVLGPSGCGKSTLLQIAAGLMAPDGGSVRIAGRLIAAPPPEAVYVFQQYTRSLLPWRNVRDNVAFATEHRLGKRSARAIADDNLAQVGLAGFGDHFPWQLSGGMQQRVAIARAYVLDPKVLLMDEPFGALDAQTRVVMQEELVRLARQHPRTVLFITHAVEEAVYLADRIVVMSARPGTVREIIDVKSIRESEDWDQHKRIEDVMDLPSFVHLRTHVWKLLRDQQGADAH